MESSLAMSASICRASSSLTRSCQAAFCSLLPKHCRLVRRAELEGCRGPAADPKRGRMGSGCCCWLSSVHTNCVKWNLNMLVGNAQIVKALWVQRISRTRQGPHGVWLLLLAFSCAHKNSLRPAHVCGRSTVNGRSQLGTWDLAVPARIVMFIQNCVGISDLHMPVVKVGTFYRAQGCQQQPPKQCVARAVKKSTTRQLPATSSTS